MVPLFVYKVYKMMNLIFNQRPLQAKNKKIDQKDDTPHMNTKYEKKKQAEEDQKKKNV